MDTGILWRRFFARLLEILLVFGVCEILLRRKLSGWQLMVVLQLLFLAYEWIIITGTGTSIGKYCFGLNIETDSGEPLSAGRILRRVIGVWVLGRALNIPVLSEAAAVIWYFRVVGGRTVPWDQWAQTKIGVRRMRALPLATLVVLVTVVMVIIAAD